MPQWHELYRDELNGCDNMQQFVQKKIAYKRAFIDRISANCPLNGRLLEIGAGSGTVAVHLTNRGYDTTIVDNSREMLDIARHVRDAIGVNTQIVEADLRQLPFPTNSFDVIYSHGVMEHFNDNDIESILRHHLIIASRVVFAVPSTQYTTKFYGDERFMNAKTWISLAQRAGQVKETFGYHHSPNAWQRAASLFRVDSYQFLGFVVHRK
jgi:SAM-dependent methyltransferase